MGKEKPIIKISLKPSRNFFTMVMVVVAVIMVWRGIWNILDMYFFPNDPILSNLLSILIGLIIMYLPDADIKDLI